MHEGDELDRLLDSALSTYADPGDNSGLEERILTRISTPATPVSRRRWMVWAIALPVTACLLLFLFSVPKPAHPPIGHAGQEYRPQQPPVLDAHTESQPVLRLQPLPRAKAPTLSAQSRRITPAAITIPFPKLDVFPAPRPLTAEERTVAAIIRQAPESELKALVEAQNRADALLSIAAIHIPPLEPPDPGAN
jgi:hypothetical protein